MKNKENIEEIINDIVESEEEGVEGESLKENKKRKILFGNENLDMTN